MTHTEAMQQSATHYLDSNLDWNMKMIIEFLANQIVNTQAFIDSHKDWSNKELKGWVSSEMLTENDIVDWCEQNNILMDKIEKIKELRQDALISVIPN